MPPDDELTLAPDDDLAPLIEAAERAAEIPLAAASALIEVLTYLCRLDAGEAA